MIREMNVGVKVIKEKEVEERFKDLENSISQSNRKLEELKRSAFFRTSCTNRCIKDEGKFLVLKQRRDRRARTG